MSTDQNGMRRNLEQLVRAPSHEGLVPWLNGLFDNPLFDIPAEMDKQERQALTYRRLRYINDQLGLDRPLSEN
ncbi:hypothetical protein AB0D38_39805, partial [Streptomyces sp. NPDC048279]|uniref:hypothetical protein n=1 Tax=Streptomyces sp. NPDC048279 TaxID=3154714 RepID=UPI00341C29EF